MDEEEAIKRITRLLEMGGTMLASHHDCGAPLFRYKGDIVCPICSFEMAEGKAEDGLRSPTALESDKTKRPEGAKIPEKSEVERPSSDIPPKNETRFGSGSGNESSPHKSSEYPDSDSERLESLESIENDDFRPVQTIGNMETSITSENAQGAQIRARKPKGESGLRKDADLVKEELQRAILSKLQEISNKMREEKDENRLKNQLECVNEALKVLESLKR